MPTPQQQQFDDVILPSQSAVAREFGVDRSTVHDWKLKGMPGTKKNFNLAKITQWLFTFGPWRSEQARDDILRGGIDK